MESTKQNTNAIKKVRKLFNNVRNNLFNEEVKRIRKELYKNEAVYNFLMKKEQEGTITKNDMIVDCKSKGEWKMQLVMRVIFVSFIDKNETQIMHTKSDNVKIMNGTDTDNAIIELINSFTKRYQEGLETKMKGSIYISERVDLLEYHLHKISLNRGSSYIKSPTWLKNKKVVINPFNTQ